MVLILGASGMLGQAVAQAAAARGLTYQLCAWNLETINPAQLRGARVVINCAGLVHGAARPAKLLMVNAVGVHVLAEACDAASVRLVHVSTDAVFGFGVGPHSERSPATPHTPYARSKFAGEVVHPPHVTVRTSFVGIGPKGLFSELTTRGREQGVFASVNALQSIHTVGTVAQLLLEVVQHDHIYGLLHVPGNYRSRWQICTTLADWAREHGYGQPVVQQTEHPVWDRRLTSIFWDDLGLPAPPPLEEQMKTFGDFVWQPFSTSAP